MGKQTVLYSWESRRYYIHGKRRYYIHGKVDGIILWESRRYYINGKADGIILMGKQTVLY